MERGTYTLAHIKSGKSTAAGSENEECNGIVCEVAMKTLIEGTALCEVCAEGFHLHQGAHHHKHVKELVALPDEVTPPREQTLWVRAAEEIRAD